MTYKTCKILTRLLTAPHVSVARRMEPFAKHLLNLASWLERLYPIATHCLMLADCGLGLWWNLSFCMKTPHCLAMVLYHSLYSQQPLPVILHSGTSLKAAVPQQWHIVCHGPKSYSCQLHFQRGCMHSISVDTALEVRRPAACFVSSQGNKSRGLLKNS